MSGIALMQKMFLMDFPTDYCTIISPEKNCLVMMKLLKGGNERL